MVIKTTYSLAMTVAKDAANRLMKKKGLKAWDQECKEKAAETFYNLI